MSAAKLTYFVIDYLRALYTITSRLQKDGGVRRKFVPADGVSEAWQRFWQCVSIERLELQLKRLDQLKLALGTTSRTGDWKMQYTRLVTKQSNLVSQLLLMLYELDGSWVRRPDGKYVKVRRDAERVKALGMIQWAFCQHTVRLIDPKPDNTS
jgi:hypothetical protein